MVAEADPAFWQAGRSGGAGSPGDITFLLRTLRRHRRSVAAAAVVGLGLGLVAQVTLPKRFSATEQLMLDYRRLVSVSPQEAVFNFRLSDAALDSQTAILVSDGVLGRAVDTLKLALDSEFTGGDGFLTRSLAAVGLAAGPDDRPSQELRQDAIVALRKALKVERIGLSYVIEITASAKTPEKAVSLADGVTDAYIADQLEARRSVANGALDWFETRLAELQADVTAANHKAIEYRLKNQIMLAAGKFIDEQQVQDLSTRLIASQERRFLAEARLARATAITEGRRQLDGLLPGNLGDETHDPVIVTLLTSYHDVSRRMQQNLAQYGPDHEAVLKDQAQMRSLQESLVSQFNQIAEGARSDVAIAAGEQAALSERLQQAADRAGQAQQARVELTLLQGAADSITALRDNFVMQYTMSTQQQNFPITETRVTSRASLISRPDWPTPRKTLVGGFALGLIAGFAFAVGNEALSRRLRTRSDLEAATGRRCLGYLPSGSVTADLLNAGPMLAERTSPEDVVAAESLKGMLLTLKARPGTCTVIGLVGTMQGDGATTVAASLGAMAAAAGQRVLLVDADLRRASLSARYGPGMAGGLAQALADPSTDTPIDAVGQGRLRVLPAGHSGAAAESTVLHPAAMTRLMDRLRPLVDLIIVDLPPLTTSVEARSIADALDGYLLSVRWNETSKAIVADCLGVNPEVQAKLLGSIYNRILLSRVDLIDDAALDQGCKALLRRHRATRSWFSVPRRARSPAFLVSK